MTRRLALLCLCFSSLPALAQDAGSTPAPFGKVLVLLGTDSEQFDKWPTVKVADRAKLKGFSNKLKVNERAGLGIVIEGYELPYSRICDVAADVVVTDPEGMVVLERISASSAKTHDPKLNTALLLKPLIPINYGTTAREGVYKVRVTVWDRVRGTSISGESTFTLGR